MTKTVRKPKAQAIVDAALIILREQGDGALSMRALAAATGMSLSNVQYYFKDKETLLRAVVEDYFELCAQTISQMVVSSQSTTPQDRLETFLRHVFSEGQEMSDMCAVFRELWAIATRNPEVSEALGGYYQRLAEIVGREVFSEVEDAQTRQQIVMLLLPYVEGYSIAGRPLGADVDATVAMISGLVAHITQPAPR